MSEQSSPSRFAAAPHAPRAQAPTNTQGKKPATLADLLRTSATPLAKAVPFPERVAGVVPSIRAPKPRVVPGPTPKRKKKLPDSIEAYAFLPREKDESLSTTESRSGASPFHIDTQAFDASTQKTALPPNPDTAPAEQTLPAGGVSPFSIDTQSFDPTTQKGASSEAVEAAADTADENGVINMRPRTTIVPKGGLNSGNSPFSNIQPQVFTAERSSGATAAGSSPFAFPPADAQTHKRDHQPVSVSAPFSLTPPPALLSNTAPAEEAPKQADAEEPILSEASAKADIVYTPDTEEEPEVPSHASILPLHVEPVFTAPPSTTHIGAWDPVADGLLTGSDAEAEAEEALRAADYGYADEPHEKEADDFAWYTPEEQTPEPAPVSKEEPLPSITEIPGKEHYHYPSVSASYDRVEDIPTYKRQITLALIGGWTRVLSVLGVFAAALALSLADLLTLPLPAFLAPDIYPLIYRMADMELLLLGIVLCLPIFLDGLSDVFHGAASAAAFFAAPTLLFLFVQATEIGYCVLTVGEPSVAFPLCSAPILFGCVLASLGQVLELHRKNTIFRHVADGSFAFTIEAEPDGTAKMKETSYPTNIASHIAQPTPCSSVSMIVLPLLLILTLVCGLVGGFHLDSVVGGLYISALVLAACFPLGRILMRSAGTFLQVKRSLATYGSCVLSEVDAQNLAATDSLALPEAAIFSGSETLVTRIHLASEDHDDGKYVLQAIGDALGGGLRVGLENRFLHTTAPVSHTDMLVKTGGDEDGVEITVDNDRVLHIGRHTFMLRHRMTPLTYTEDDARAERLDKLQILFVAEEGTIFAKLFLHLSIAPDLRDHLLTLSATGKQVLVETNSPFFGEEHLHAKLGDARAPIHVCHKGSSLCAPLAKPTQGGLLAASPDGALALLAELSDKRSSRMQRVLLSAASALLGVGSVAAVLLIAPLSPFVAPVLSAVQLLHLPLSKHHPKKRT